MILNWGIVSAGKISSDFINAIKVLNNSKHCIVAISATDLERASEMAAKHAIANAYGSHEELARNESIDVVYIGTINSLHYTVIKMMLEAGKNVVAEKPFCTNYKDTEELITLARAKKLFLMEGIWSRCFPMYRKLKEVLNNAVIGRIFHVEANLGKQIAQIERIKSKELGGGVILDLGVYVLQLAVYVFGAEPLEIKCVGTLNDDDVDTNACILLNFAKDQTANLNIHSKVVMTNCARIYGSNGFIEIPEEFWCPTRLSVNGTLYSEPLPEKGTIPFNFPSGIGLCYEAEEVYDCIEKGLLESPCVPHKDTLVISRIQNELHKQLGVQMNSPQ